MSALTSPVTTIVIAQLFGTSLWFSTNSAAGSLMAAWHLGESDIGLLTNAVQLGFISGTLTFSLSGLADRFEASRIFTVCALLGALFNTLFALVADGLGAGLPLRFAVGCCLAGIYPLGMKLIVSWAPERAGGALSLLLAMLTLGTALPHFVRFAGTDLSWQATIIISSGLAMIAAVMIWRLGDGPHLIRSANARHFRLGRVLTAFSIPAFRASALGYFGHCWELYAFWTLVPTLIMGAGLAADGTSALSGMSFLVISIGSLGCILGGWWGQRIGSGRTAAIALFASGCCCLLFPLIPAGETVMLLALLLFWGTTVIADSPHFSALSARACPPEIVGSALTLQNAIGFSITMVSIQLGTSVVDRLGAYTAWLLLPGAILGLWGLAPLWRPSSGTTPRSL
jgi:MFS family permease